MTELLGEKLCFLNPVNSVSEHPPKIIHIYKYICICKFTYILYTYYIMYSSEEMANMIYKKVSISSFLYTLNILNCDIITCTLEAVK